MERSGFGRLARELRISRGVSQTRFAELAGMSLARVSNLEHRRTNISDDVVGLYIEVLNLSGREAHDLRTRASFSNSIRQTDDPKSPASPLQVLLMQFGDRISPKGLARLQKVLEEETGEQIASLNYSSAKVRHGKAGTKKRPKRAPAPLPTTFARICLLAEKVRSLVSTETQRTDLTLLLDILSLQDDRFDYDVIEVLPAFAEGAFACITGHAEGHTLLLEQHRMASASRGKYFWRHAIAHEIGHHCLHSDLLKSEGTLILPPQELAKNRTDAEDLGFQIEQVVDTSIEVEAECFATFLLVPWTAFLKGTSAEYLARDYGEQPDEVRRYYYFFKNPTLINAFKQELWDGGRRDHPVFDIR